LIIHLQHKLNYASIQNMSLRTRVWCRFMFFLPKSN
jgi:hypothetical protein